MSDEFYGDETPHSSHDTHSFCLLAMSAKFNIMKFFVKPIKTGQPWIFFSSGKCQFFCRQLKFYSHLLTSHHCSSHGHLLCPDKANNLAQCTTTLVRPPIEASRRLENSIASGSARSEKWTATRPSHTEPWRFPVISRRTRSSYLCVVVGLIVHVWCECGVRV